jgi:hypothetical protein
MDLLTEALVSRSAEELQSDGVDEDAAASAVDPVAALSG